MISLMLEYNYCWFHKLSNVMNVLQKAGKNSKSNYYYLIEKLQLLLEFQSRKKCSSEDLKT